jgi:hypothetical protein
MPASFLTPGRAPRRRDAMILDSHFALALVAPKRYFSRV